MITAVNGEYMFAASLASTVIETALHQHFLKDHFPTITDCKESLSPTEYITDLVFRTLNIKA